MISGDATAQKWISDFAVCLIFLQRFIWNIWRWQQIPVEYAVILKSPGRVKKWSDTSAEKSVLGFAQCRPLDRSPLLWMASGFVVFWRPDLLFWDVRICCFPPPVVSYFIKATDERSLGKHINGKHGETELKTIFPLTMWRRRGKSEKRPWCEGYSMWPRYERAKFDWVLYTHIAIDTPIWGP